MAYIYHPYYANVIGWSKIRLVDRNATGSWVDGDVFTCGNPFGKPFIYRRAQTQWYDDQYSGTLYSALPPYSSQSFPRMHPDFGTGDYVEGNAGKAFGYYESSSFGFYSTGLARDYVPTSQDFMVLNQNVSSYLVPNSKLYNSRVMGYPASVNLTSSWVEVPNTTLTGTGVGVAFVEVIPSGSQKQMIYAFGGISGALFTTSSVNTNFIFVCSASFSGTDIYTLKISPWFRQDAEQNIWPGTSASLAYPSPGGTPLTIPVAPGVTDGAACYDSTSKTLYFAGGIRQSYVSSSDIISGSNDVWAWRIDDTTGLITGSYFLAGQMPRGRFKHEMVVAGGFIYFVGGATGSTYHSVVDRALINDDGTLTDWEVCPYDLPPGVNVSGVGAGLVDGAALVNPSDAMAPAGATQTLWLIGGLKQFNDPVVGGIARASSQLYSADLNFVKGADKLADPNKFGIDPSWQGPATGEQVTVGAQLGASDIKPVLPLLDNVYQQLMVSTIPSGTEQFLGNAAKLIGYRPGLRGTEMNGMWTIKFATTPGAFLPDGGAALDHWPSLTSSQVYFRQVRLEFTVDTTSGYSDIQYFNPARERLYKKSGTGLRNGRRLIDIISGSAWWDAGVSYVYSYVQPEYGRTVGITTSSGSDDFAVFTQLTGVLADVVSNTPDWYLNPPPGEGITGLPYIPLSSGSIGEASIPLSNTGSAVDMMRATIDPQLPIPADDTLEAYLSRIKAIRTTQDAYEQELLRQAELVASTGSLF